MWDPEFILTALTRCARNVAEHRKECSWELKSDNSLVTQIDSANEQFLKSYLPKEGEYFLGEETIESVTQEYLDAAFKGVTYVVDPIDGTAPFAHGLPLWAISIGYMENGFFTNGGIMLPDLNEAYISSGDDVLYTNDITLPLSQWKVLPPIKDGWSVGLMLITGQSYTKKNLLPFKNPILVPGSAVQAFSALLSGKVGGYIGHMKLWDIAGSIPLVTRAGLKCQLFNGIDFVGQVNNDIFYLDLNAPKTWQLRDNIITAPPAIHAELKKMIFA